MDLRGFAIVEWINRRKVVSQPQLRRPDRHLMAPPSIIEAPDPREGIICHELFVDGIQDVMLLYPQC